jgi:hypothetical protein
LRYHLRKRNLAFDAAADPPAVNSFRHHFVMPATNNADGCYLDPALGGATFFSKCEVLINGYLVEGPVVGDAGFVHQIVNRTWCGQNEQRKKYGRTIPRISTMIERTYPTAAGSQLSHILAENQFDGQTETRDIVTHFSFDAYWPLCSQSNILRTLQRTDVEGGFLPPETQINIRLHVRSPIDALIERPRISDAHYNEEAREVEAADYLTLFPTFKELFIMYDSVTLESVEQLNRIKRMSIRYYADVPNISLQQVASGSNHTVNTVTIPRATKALVLLWPVEWQIFFNAGRRKNLCGRFTFPANGKRFRINLKDRDGLLIKEGLDDFGVVDAQTSATCRAYHLSLAQKGLYSKPFSSLFPRGPMNLDRSYDQIIILDLTPYTIADKTEIEVTVDYENPGSPIKLWLMAMTYQQYCYTYGGKGMAVKHEIVD